MSEFEKDARKAILGLAGATTAAADQADAMTDEELGRALLSGAGEGETPA